MKKRDIPNMMYMAVIPILTYQIVYYDIKYQVIQICHQFRLILALHDWACLILFVFRYEISEANRGESYETKVDGVQEIPFLSLNEHKGASKENSKYKKKANPDGDGLGDIHLLPVLVFKLVEVLPSCRPYPRCGHPSGWC